MNFNEFKELVKTRHGNQKRKQGTPYYLHPFAVADILKEAGYGEDYQIVGLFHDLLEDTQTTYEEILSISTYEIANAVKLLTKEEDYKMDEYMSRIKLNELAKAVKLADRIHNLSEAHHASDKWIAKYVAESEEWFLELAENTLFENELCKHIDELKKNISY